MKTKKQKEADRKWYLKNRDRILLMRKEYHKQNAETIRKRVRKWRSKNPEKHRTWNRLYARTEKQRENSRDRYKNNKEKITKQIKLWRSKNPDKVRVSKKASKARRRFLCGEVKTQTVQAVYEDNIKKYGTLTCELCFNPIILGDDSLEHKTPICRGGTNDYSNLAITHLKCNLRKGKKTMPEELHGKDI